MEKYILKLGPKVYNADDNEFVTDVSKATEFDLSEATKKRRKLMKKVFGNIFMAVVHKEETK